MRSSVRLITKEAIFKYCAEGTRNDWIAQFQGMVALAGSQTWWTWEVEDVFNKVAAGDKKAMKTYSEKLHVQLDEMVVKVRSDLSKNERKKLNTMLIIDVHARDIVDSFVRDSIMSIKEFEWESQVHIILSLGCIPQFIWYSCDFIGTRMRTTLISDNAQAPLVMVTNTWV